MNNVNGDADGAKSVFAVDMDGDDDIDILAASFNDDKVTWYESGSPDPYSHPYSE